MRFHFSVWVLLIGYVVFGQTPLEEFERAKQNQTSRFHYFKATNDSLFVLFIKESWRKFEMKAPEAPISTPRPVLPPTFDEMELSDFIWQEWPNDTVQMMRSFSPEPLETPEYFPDIQIHRLSFFGADSELRYASEFFEIGMAGNGNETLINFWLAAGKKGYQMLVEDIRATKEEFSLPDYAIYLLVRDLVAQLVPDEHRRSYFEWFLLNKVGYACKMAYMNNTPVLLLGTNGKMYGRSYFQEDGLFYYLTSALTGELFTYGNQRDNVLKPFDFAIPDPIQLPLKPSFKRITFDYMKSTYVLEVAFNENTTQLLNQFPQVDFRYYLLSKASQLTVKSVHKQLDPILAEMSNVERLKFLLALVQFGFAYKSDQAQFGREKVMYPDEFLRYPFSDCDDRVVWLAFLIMEFTNLEIVAVTFPQHAALAVQLSAPIYGESVLIEGRKYIFCDPTYLGAPLGTLIPEADKNMGRIIRITR